MAVPSPDAKEVVKLGCKLRQASCLVNFCGLLIEVVEKKGARFSHQVIALMEMFPFVDCVDGTQCVL